ncbi:MAG TPA: hypothetical protein ENJ28_04920 [Gammaproteobacteria bacterium]|nr:hypothetical protein [Gammaproteobacteria bacterium]
MGTLTTAPFGTYTGVGIVVQTSQDEIIANLNSLKALFTSGTVSDDGSTNAHPDFDKIPPEAGNKLAAEIDAMIVVIDAMPVA